MTLRIEICDAPVGTLWKRGSYDHDTNTVEVVGYERPDNAELMTIPPFTEDQLAQIAFVLPSSFST